MPLLVHPAAEREMAQALQWASANFGEHAKVRLGQRLRQAGELLLLAPELGTPATKQARRLPLAGYPYTLVYRVQGDRVQLLALMHQSRLPDYWLSRG